MDIRSDIWRGGSLEADEVFRFSAIPKNLCKTIVNKIRLYDSWQESEVYALNQLVIDKRTRNALVLGGENFREERQLLHELFVSKVVKISGKKRLGLPHFVRYRSGGYYQPHRDTSPATNDRRITVLCYLNDDFSGGGTAFPELNHEVKPIKGTAIIFPSYYVHSGMRISKGEKYISIAWLHKPKLKDWITQV